DLYITILSQLLNKIQKHSQIRLRLAKEYHFKLENRLLYKINVIQKAKGKISLYIILPFLLFSSNFIFSRLYYKIKCEECTCIIILFYAYYYVVIYYILLAHPLSLALQLLNYHFASLGFFFFA